MILRMSLSFVYNVTNVYIFEDVEFKIYFKI